MLRSIQPLQLLLTLLAGWINRRQLEAIEYLKEENRSLKERLGVDAFQRRCRVESRSRRLATTCIRTNFREPTLRMQNRCCC
jgi:hypothetical protein